MTADDTSDCPTVILTGDPIDGLTIWGPFDSSDDAVAWANNELRHQCWWIAPVQAPTDA